MVVGRGRAIAFVGEVRRGNSDVEFWARGSEREREKCVEDPYPGAVLRGVLLAKGGDGMADRW